MNTPFFLNSAGINEAYESLTVQLWKMCKATDCEHIIVVMCLRIVSECTGVIQGSFRVYVVY